MKLLPIVLLCLATFFFSTADCRIADDGQNFLAANPPPVVPPSQSVLDRQASSAANHNRLQEADVTDRDAHQF